MSEAHPLAAAFDRLRKYGLNDSLTITEEMMEDSKAQQRQEAHDELLADCIESLVDASTYLRGAELSKEEAAKVQAAALSVQNWAFMALYRAQEATHAEGGWSTDESR